MIALQLVEDAVGKELVHQQHEALIVNEGGVQIIVVIIIVMIIIIFIIIIIIIIVVVVTVIIIIIIIIDDVGLSVLESRKHALQVFVLGRAVNNVVILIIIIIVVVVVVVENVAVVVGKVGACFSACTEITVYATAVAVVIIGRV